MKIFKLFTTLIILTVLSQKVFGTAQVPDYLIINGDTLAIFSNPLESYFEKSSRPDSVFDKYGYNSTACWRGYVGYWELRNDSLFLLELQGDTSAIDLSLIFKDRETSNNIFADWFDNSILNPHGELIFYGHMGYGSIYQFEKEFVFSNGILTSLKEFDNSKSKKSKYTENPELLKKFLRESINYSNIKSEPYERARVYVQILNVTENGKIDSVSVVRGWDTERDKEAIRVVKSIPEWDIVYSQGKQIQITWTVAVIFGESD